MPLQMAFHHLPVGMGLFHLDGRTIYTNPAFRALHQIDPGIDTKNCSFSDLADRGAFANWKENPRLYFERVRRALKRTKHSKAEVAIGDRIIFVQDMLLDDHYILSSQIDITDRVAAERQAAKSEQQAAHLAIHDLLTDLPNRAAFAAKLSEAISLAKARGMRFAVLLGDLDDFKDVNDIFGHSDGDTLLKDLADRFRLTAGHDFVARSGGDEFSFICFDESQPEAANMLADRLLQTASSEMEIDGQSLVAGLSLGIAIYPSDGEDAAALLNCAEAALYRAKHDGRALVRFFEPAMDRRIHEQRLLLQELRSAIPRQELRLCYQPEATVDGEITGFEVLLRWDNPARGRLMPDVFVPLAEESGLIVNIGEWVLREACHEAVRWAKPLNVAVNVSPVQFRHGDLAATILGILVETGLPPHRLEIEITEGVLVDDFTRALATLRRIKALGVKIAMDDFGTGYSSLSYLQAFPFDKLKIDKSFTMRVPSDRQAGEIIRAIIGLGRGLDLPILAEGVETAEQRAFLEAEQCHAMQGHLVGLPQPIEAYQALTSGAPVQSRRIA